MHRTHVHRTHIQYYINMKYKKPKNININTEEVHFKQIKKNIQISFNTLSKGKQNKSNINRLGSNYMIFIY